MDMKEVTFAQLQSDAVNQLQKFEEQLKRETKRDIILLAYEKSHPAK